MDAIQQVFIGGKCNLYIWNKNIISFSTVCVAFFYSLNCRSYNQLKNARDISRKPKSKSTHFWAIFWAFNIPYQWYHHIKKVLYLPHTIVISRNILCWIEMWNRFLKQLSKISIKLYSKVTAAAFFFENIVKRYLFNQCASKISIYWTKLSLLKCPVNWGSSAATNVIK